MNFPFSVTVPQTYGPIKLGVKDWLSHKFGYQKNAYSTLETVQYIQVDHTTKCNLMCPQCGRIDQETGEFNKQIPMTELELEDYSRIFTPSLSKTLKRIFFCGNYGDVIASNTFMPCLEYLRQTGFERMDIVTNGSVRSPEWWRDLAMILNKPKDTVIFSIDGLEDTNHLYRVNSKWSKIMANVEAFISAGGRARWDMLVFEHNEHQIEQAKEMAKKMGFVAFSVKKTNRFVHSGNFKAKSEKINLSNRKGEYEIKAPAREIHKGTAFTALDKIQKEYGSWENYINQSEIECKFSKNGNGLFLDFEGRIWPCTWIAALPYTASNLETKQIKQIMKNYGENFNSTRHHSLGEILDSPWFNQDLKKSWCGTAAGEIPKISACSRNCGKKFHHTSSSDRNREMINL